MPTYSVEFERLWAKQSKELGRDLTEEESRRLDAVLFHSWIETGRLDELIHTTMTRSGRDGGLEEVMVLGHHLREIKDEARIHSFFRGLIRIRVKAFHEWWPQAAQGHIGCMCEAARASAEVMNVYVEYFHSLDRLGLDQQKEALREEMLRFQAREPVSRVLPMASKKKTP